jgi:hypothetical protein
MPCGCANKHLFLAVVKSWRCKDKGRSRLTIFHLDRSASVPDLLLAADLSIDQITDGI